MVITCSAPGCSAKKDSVTSKSSILFHRFPLRKPDVLAKWVKAIKSPTFRPTVTSYLCGAHFTASDYEIKPNNAGKHLKSNAVPTVFEKRRPGRKKKIVTENENTEEKNNEEEFIEDQDVEGDMEEEYLEVGENDKVQSNLADIIGDQEKGTLHVLIVDENGKITNSEYIFKKEGFSDDELKDDLDVLSQEDYKDRESDEENFGGNSGDKWNQTESSPDIILSNYRDLKNREKIKELESNLLSTRKKLKITQLKCRKMSRKIKELQLLLKMLVLKRGKGEKTLKQLLKEYDKQEFDEMKSEIKEEEPEF